MYSHRFLLPRLRRPSSVRKTRRVCGLVRTGGDEGFSLVEVLVAIGVFGVVAAMLSGLTATGLRGVLLGKRREVATAEATRTLEIARSLSYNAVGLIQTDPTITDNSDPAIQTVGGVKRYQVSGGALEPVIWATSGAGHPFNPHRITVTRGSTLLTRYVYVTGVDSNNDGALDLRRVSVRVTWPSTGTPGAAPEVRAQTLVNPSGIVSNNTLTPLKAQTSAEGGSASVRNGHGSIAQLINAVLPVDPVVLRLPSSTGKSTFRGVSSINCTGRSTFLGSGTLSYGGHSVSVTADDDSRTDTPVHPSPLSWTGSDGISGLDDVDNLLVETSMASPVSCAASAEDNDGAAPSDDNLPYEKGTGSGPASLNFTTDLTGAGLASNVLSALVVSPQPISQEIDDAEVSGTRETRASATSGQGVVNVLKIPGVLQDGLVRVDAMSYGASIRASEATPSQAPTVTAPNPLAVRVYDPANALTGCSSRSGGYCIYNVNPLGSGFSGLSAHSAGSFTQNLGLTKLTYSIDVDVLPPTKDPLNGVVGPTGERRWSAEYAPMTVSARLTIEVTVNALLGITVVLTDTQVDMDLGKVVATGCAGVTCL